MIVYLFKSGLSLAIILGLYHWMLQKEKMLQFNRFFLLFGLIFSFSVPLVSIGFNHHPLMSDDLLSVMQVVEFNFINGVESTEQSQAGLNYNLLFSGSYWLITGLFFCRFLYQIANLWIKVSRHKRVAFHGVNLVLIKETSLPYTFFDFIFVNETAYQQDKIEAELFTHELAHARQYHSLDILLIEALLIFFWFNPFLWMYKQAIQLNHEFLADDQVIHIHQQIPAYQHLLLDKSIITTEEVSLVSNLNFSITKKRLTMMSKNTSRLKAFTLASLTMPFFIALLLLFGGQAMAQSPSTSTAKLENLKDQYFQHAMFEFTNKAGQKIYKPYAAFTSEEKLAIPMPPPPPPVNASAKKEATMESLPKGTLVRLDKDGKQLTIELNAKIPPPPPVSKGND